MSSEDEQDWLSSSGPPPTKLSPQQSSNDLESKLTGILKRLEEFSDSIGDLQQKQAEMAQKQDVFYQKQEEADSVRRNQIDCVSNRVYAAEKQLSESSRLQDDAISKANAVFEKHACEVEQERQNLMSVIGQVNRNFEHLSGEIAQHGDLTNGFEEERLHLQQNIDEVSEDCKRLSHAVFNQSTDVSAALQNVTVIEQALHQLQAQTNDVLADQQETNVTLRKQRAEMVDVLAKVQDAEVLMQKATPQIQVLVGEQLDFRERLKQTDSSVARALRLLQSPPEAWLAAQQPRRPTQPQELPQTLLSPRCSELDDISAPERGSAPHGERDMWRREAMAPEPAALGQPAFMRSRRSAENSPDDDQVHIDHRPQIGGGIGYPGVPLPRVLSNMQRMEPGAAGARQRHTNVHNSFPGAWDEEDSSPTATRLGTAPGHHRPVPSMSPMSEEALRVRQLGSGGPAPRDWDADDHSSEDPDCQDEIYVPQHDQTWGSRQPYASHQDPEHLKYLRAHSSQPNAFDVPPVAMSDFADGLAAQKRSAEQCRPMRLGEAVSF